MDVDIELNLKIDSDDLKQPGFGVADTDIKLNLKTDDDKKPSFKAGSEQANIKHSFRAISESEELNSLNYWRAARVARFFDEENKILIRVVKDEGVYLFFENGFALELPPAVVPLIRIPTASGKTLVYDVAMGKPLPDKYQGWEGVETVKRQNMLT